jgi:hypothetical protein
MRRPNVLLSLHSEYEQFVMNGRIFVRLKKVLYGLKEASKAWYRHLGGILGSFGLKVSNFDAGLFFADFGEGRFIFVLVHVDDILASPKKEIWRGLRTTL